MYILRHVARVAAHVEVGTPLQPRPKLLGCFQHAMLDVDPIGLVAGERQVEPVQLAFPVIIHEFVAIKEIRRLMLFSEEQPIAPRRALHDALLEKGTEWRKPHPRSAHNNVPGPVLRQAERARLLHIDRNVLHEHIGVVGEEAGGQTLFRAAVGLIAHHRNAQVRFVGVGLRRGGNRIQPRHHGRELGYKRGGRREPGFVEFPQDVHVVARINVFAESVAVIDKPHQAAALFALRDVLGQGHYHLPVRPVDGVIPQQRLPERRGLALGVIHLGPAAETQQRDHILHQLRGVAAEDA